LAHIRTKVGATARFCASLWCIDDKIQHNTVLTSLKVPRIQTLALPTKDTCPVNH